MARRAALPKGELEVARIVWGLGSATVRPGGERMCGSRRAAQVVRCETVARICCMVLKSAGFTR